MFLTRITVDSLKDKVELKRLVHRPTPPKRLPLWSLGKYAVRYRITMRQAYLAIAGDAGHAAGVVRGTASRKSCRS